MPSSYTIKLSSEKNLKLAWSRIKTGQNIFYKNFYRNLFLAYEISYEENIEKLSTRLKGGSYIPSKILRFYLPKSSGLHRPITFLHLEDLIVYQAYANLFFDKFSKSRFHIEGINVFSYLFNRDKNKDIFVFKKWQEGYSKFLQKIKASYNEGFKWIVHFDIAAYYDTISHTTLSNQIAPRSSEEYRESFRKCLETWSTPKNKNIGHGIPQGPLASNLIGEIYFIPIDRVLNKNNVRYLRYVDDINIFGKTKEEVLNGVIILEKECKERGLIPQSKKFEIKEAKNIEEAIGKSPSISQEEKKYFFINEDKTSEIFFDAFYNTPMDVTRVKYILKSIGKNSIVFKIIIDRLNEYPELSLEFCEFLKNYFEDTNIGIEIYKKALEIPSNFEYVHGNYWDLLSYYQLDERTRAKFIIIAIRRLKKAYHFPYLRLGLYKFIASNKKKTVINWLKHEKIVLLQMMAVKFVENTCYDLIEYKDFANHLLKRSNFESSLVLYKELIYHLKFTLIKSLDRPTKDYTGILRNTLGKPDKIDAIGEILSRRFKISLTNKWIPLLNNNYEHANNLIFNADNSFDIDRNAWISYTDSFNDIIIRSFIILLVSRSPLPRPLTWPNILNRNSQMIDYGVLLDNNNQLSINYSNIIDGFRKFHKRRSETPTSHPFDKRTQNISRFVSHEEQKNLLNMLKVSYINLIITVDRLIP